MSKGEICIFRGRYDFLSNFYSSEIRYEGLTFHNAEAAFQAQKCVDESEKAKFTEISAVEAKRRGRKVDCRKDWDLVRVDVMRGVVRAKFMQNLLLAQWLLDTGEQTLKEGNDWHDTFWGVDNKSGEGENHLGEILMEVRIELKEKGLLVNREAAEGSWDENDKG